MGTVEFTVGPALLTVLRKKLSLVLPDSSGSGAKQEEKTGRLGTLGPSGVLQRLPWEQVDKTTKGLCF